jgi:DNA/RNA-binding protein KIN17
MFNHKGKKASEKGPMGLKKLKFYCELCSRQCGNENGFNCHLKTEAHLRQVALFAEDPNKRVAAYSDKFRAGFMAVLTGRYLTATVEPNRVYNEYIRDRGHTHMTATKWVTLTGFVYSLSDDGLVELVDVDTTPEGMCPKIRLPRAKQQQQEADNAAAAEGWGRGRGNGTWGIFLFLFLLLL